MKSNKGKYMINMGLILIISALLLACYNIWDENRAIKNAAEALSAVEIIMEDRQENKQDKIIPEYVRNPGMQMPLNGIDGWDYVGTISIPSLDITLPVINECSPAALKNAPCRYYGSVYKDDMVISAHNYKRFFAELKNIQTGAVAVFTDMNGNVFEYEMFCVEILKPTQAEEMISGEWDMTLFTCTPGGGYRIAVRFLRISGY
ncbi:MAG: sortase [Anaerofustis stercorihominis]|nr:sortase [Anaerofustis stercorihominis]